MDMKTEDAVGQPWCHVSPGASVPEVANVETRDCAPNHSRLLTGLSHPVTRQVFPIPTSKYLPRLSPLSRSLQLV